MSKRKDIDHEWLRQQYVELDRTIKEIADELGYNPQVVHKNLVRYKIPRRRRYIRESKLRAYYLSKDLMYSVQRLRVAMIFLYGKKCMYPNCTYEKFVDLHHIRGRNEPEKFNGTRHHSNNRFSQTVLLCPNHHREADNKLISIEELEKIIQTRKLKT